MKTQTYQLAHNCGRRNKQEERERVRERWRSSSSLSLSSPSRRLALSSTNTIIIIKQNNSHTKDKSDFIPFFFCYLSVDLDFRFVFEHVSIWTKQKDLFLFILGYFLGVKQNVYFWHSNASYTDRITTNNKIEMQAVYFPSKQHWALFHHFSFFFVFLFLSKR